MKKILLIEKNFMNKFIQDKLLAKKDSWFHYKSY